MNRYHNYTKEKILSFILDHKESCFEWNDLVMAFGWKRMSTEGHLLMALIRPSMSEMDRELLPERQMADNIKAFAWDNKLQVIIGREMITGRMEDIDKVFFLNKDFRELAEVVDGEQGRTRSGLTTPSLVVRVHHCPTNRSGKGRPP
jgi:hypothetical protein